jgi:hypothetical protein
MRALQRGLLLRVMDELLRVIFGFLGLWRSGYWDRTGDEETSGLMDREEGAEKE